MKIYRIRDTHQQVRVATSEDGKTFYGLSGDPFYEGTRITNEVLEVAQVLAPVEPKAIYAIGLNYAKHAEETGAKKPNYPVVFMKSPTSVLDPDSPILLPRTMRSDAVDYECELAVVIGFPCKSVSADDAMNYVLGYTCANDVSARDWQSFEKGGGQFSRAKSFDTFCPLGPALVPTSDLEDPSKLTIETRLNGEAMQSDNTSDMIFSVPQIIEFLSGSTTLEAGTVILTGTPSGVGTARDPQVFLKPGDRVEVEIEGIGVLANSVEEESV